MKINIESINHKDQRYPTVGDYYSELNNTADKISLEIRVSKMDNWRYEFLVALHELIEVALVKHNGIDVNLIDNFDIEFEKNRAVTGATGEPGDESDAPYRAQHLIATGIEKVLAGLLDVDWKKYEKTIENL